MHGLFRNKAIGHELTRKRHYLLAKIVRSTTTAIRSLNDKTHISSRGVALSGWRLLRFGTEARLR